MAVEARYKASRKGQGSAKVPHVQSIQVNVNAERVHIST